MQGAFDGKVKFLLEEWIKKSSKKMKSGFGSVYVVAITYDNSKAKYHVKNG